jgi:phosphoserine phosphatase
MTHVLVLTGSAPLDLKAVVAAADAAGAGRPVALAPEAAEAPLPDGDPARLARARAALGVAGVDVNAVPVARRRKRLLVADMDSTIIGCECIDEIADMVGIGPHVSAITERAMRGELNFESALAERVALLKGVTEDLLLRVFDERVRLNPGAATLVRTMREGGADTALVSGGFTFFARRVADEAGFAQHFASHLEIIGGQLTGRVLPPIVGREGKAARLRALAEAGGYALTETLAVGDGANDLMMLGEAGLGVAYRAKPAVAAAAHARIEHSDLTALLHLQGIPVAEWVR